MQANEIGQIPLKSKSQALNQCGTHVNYFISLIQFPRPMSRSLQTQLEDDLSPGISLSPCNNSSDPWNYH